MKESPDLSNAVSTSAGYLSAESPQTQEILGNMVQMTLAQPLVAPQRVVLRTQHRSMAATPLVVRATRQTRVARCTASAAADTSKVRCGHPEHQGVPLKVILKYGSDTPLGLRSRSFISDVAPTPYKRLWWSSAYSHA